MTDMVGQQLGNYRLTRLLGQGGFADVYLGEHIHLNTQAAIKVLRTRITDDNAAQFQAEAQTIAHMDHPNIVRVLEFGVDDGTPFLVMDYALNGTLRQRHPKGSQLPLAFIIPYIQQAGEALQYAHSLRIIHRDLKPENMLLSKRGEVLLSDFGLAVTTQSSRYSSTQEIVGTVAYMSPEQLQGKPGPASDQYALGIVIYEWLCGKRPFQGSFMEIYSQHMTAPPPSLCAQLPDLPHYVEQAVFMALAKKPADRFQSVRAFANALVQASQAMDSSGRDVTLRRPQSPTPPPIGSSSPQLAPQPPAVDPASQIQPAPASFTTRNMTGQDQSNSSFSQAPTLPPSISTPILATPTPMPVAPNSIDPGKQSVQTPPPMPLRAPGQTQQTPGKSPQIRRRRGGGWVALFAILLLVVLLSVAVVPRLTSTLTGQHPAGSLTSGTSTTSITEANTSTPDATATSTATTAPMATTTVTSSTKPPAAGQLLYQANWSQNLDGWLGSTQWKQINNGELGSDGSSANSNSLGGFIIWSPAQLTIANYKIIAQIQYVRSTGYYSQFEFGIMARGDGNESGYVAGMATEHCSNSQQPEADISNIDDANYSPSSCLNDNNLVGQSYPSDTNFHTYEFDVTDNALTLYIDNRLIAQTTDNTYIAAGQVGLRDIWGDINVKSFAVYAL